MSRREKESEPVWMCVSVREREGKVNSGVGRSHEEGAAAVAGNLGLRHSL